MPIPVTCQCGQSFAAGDHLAGRTVQCPKCQKPLTIPAAGAPAAANPSPFGGPAPGGANIFDQAGMRNFSPDRPTCPSCTAELPPNAVLCVKCGYHLKLGRKVGAQPAAGGAIHGDGHGGSAADTLSRAAAEIDAKKEEDRKELKQGMPWWAIGGIFLLAITFLLAMLLLPNDVALEAGGYTISVICGLISLYHGIRILIIAFNDSIVHGLCCIFVPCYGLVYVIMHWDQCGGHFIWQVIASVIGNGAGGTMIAVAPYAKPVDPNKPASFNPAPIVRELTAADFNYPRPTLKPNTVQLSTDSTQFIALLTT